MKRSLASLAVLTLVVTACGGDAADDTTPETTPPVTTPETEPAADTTMAPPETTTAPETTAAPDTTTAETPSGEAVGLADSGLGSILVDAEGNTLYLFTPDAQGESTCYDACADNWPALTGDVTAGEGVDGSLLGTTERTDGSVQVTYNGWPLYYFANDAAPGDTNGQGINDVWFAVDAAGDAVEG